MGRRAYNLAIDTSGRIGSISLGCGDDCLASVELLPRCRHNIELIPAIARLCEQHGIEAGQVGEVYVALGPGSFTGLRVALATVKMLALARGVKVVGVASLAVVAQNVPGRFEHVAVGLNLKRGTMHAGVFSRQADGTMGQVGPAGLWTLEELLAIAPRPVGVIGDPLPPEAEGVAGADVTVLEPTLAKGRSEVVWQLGRRRAKRGEFDAAEALSPRYVREPEAVVLWEQRHGDT